MVVHFAKYVEQNKHLISLRLFRDYLFIMYRIKDTSVILRPITMNREISATYLGEVVLEIT